MNRKQAMKVVHKELEKCCMNINTIPPIVIEECIQEMIDTSTHPKWAVMKWFPMRLLKLIQVRIYNSLAAIIRFATPR